MDWSQVLVSKLIFTSGTVQFQSATAEGAHVMQTSDIRIPFNSGHRVERRRKWTPRRIKTDRRNPNRLDEQDFECRTYEDRRHEDRDGDISDGNVWWR